MAKTPEIKHSGHGQQNTTTPQSSPTKKGPRVYNDGQSSPPLKDGQGFRDRPVNKTLRGTYFICNDAIQKSTRENLQNQGSRNFDLASDHLDAAMGNLTVISDSEEEGPQNIATSTHRTRTFQQRSMNPSPSTKSSIKPPPYSTPPTLTNMSNRRGEFNFYVVYSGPSPFVYSQWYLVKRMLQNDPTLVFKGFKNHETAMASWNAANQSGVVSVLKKLKEKTHWVVIEGAEPAVYSSAYSALRDGLHWGGGFLVAFQIEHEAMSFFSDRVAAGRVERTASPGFFPESE